MDSRVLILFACLTLAQCRSANNPTCRQIRQFVDGHNHRRLQLAKGEISGQPAASDMTLMTWDDELAAKAIKWASRNIFQHNPDITIGSGRFETGENVCTYWTTNSSYKFNPDEALKAWFEEHKDFTFGPLRSSQFDGSGPQVGHYTQMAWAESTNVGCGISQKTENGWKKFFVVCNYGPLGNMLGETPYKADGKRQNLICEGDRCDHLYGDKC